MARDEELLVQIFAKVSDVSERLGKVETQCNTMEKDIATIKEEDATQNRLLAEHIEGVQTNRERLNIEIQYRQEHQELNEEKFKKYDQKLEELEAPRKFLSTLISLAKAIGVLAGGIGGLYYIWTLF